ncbi:unnamed protein product [Paramecium pentaurelia]|uniref:Uncharacterized protein n=1 Tax=Paramecium pentaurelia TaxID=43138 RepID=A0A8S1UAJ5_9CILI|nr:unnamed protein product [Paramecium pentaurelia]
MPRCNPLFTERFDQILAQMVEAVGEARWADIARQMKQIYDFDIPQQTMIYARWKAIDPKINRDPFNQEEMAQHWRMCVKYSCNWEEIRKAYEKQGQLRDKGYLASKYYQIFWFKLSDLNRGIANLSDYNQPKIDQIRDITKKRIMELNGKDVKLVKNKSAIALIKGCKTLIKVMSFMVDNYKLDQNLLNQEVLRIITVERFQEALFHIFTIDTMILISLNEIRPNDDFTDLFEINEEIKQKYKKPTKIKTWNSALVEASSDEHTEDEDVLQVEVKVNKFLPKNQFTKDDITQIKDSEIYKLCSTDQNHKFYSWYNQAKDDQEDLIVNVKEFNDTKEKAKQQELQKPENRWQLKKKTPYVAKKQMKAIEKKKKMILSQDQKEKDKIKTVRGRIKLDKELFHCQYTKFFDKEPSESEVDEDDYHYSLVDADQIYKLMMNNQHIK